MAKREVIWSQKAKIKLFNILDFYKNNNKSASYSQKLYREFNHQLSLVDKQPKMGIKTDFERIRGLIVEHFILYYEVTKEYNRSHSLGFKAKSKQIKDLTPWYFK